MKRIMTSKYHKIPLHEYENIMKRIENGESIRDIAVSYGVIDHTIYNIMNKCRSLENDVKYKRFE